MPILQSQSFVFDARPHYPLLVSVKRYWVPGLESTEDDAVTFVLAHATSFPKEIWEPVLEDLYTQVPIPRRGHNSPVLKIRDAWAIECPNHGEGAVLNEEVLRFGYTPIFSWEEYARAIHLVLNGFGKGINVDFKSRNLVGVGHSMGVSAIILTRTMHPFVPWSSAILVEPVFIHPDLAAGSTNLAAGAVKRRDMWSSREEAHKLFRERSFKSWDLRSIDLYVRYGLRELPTLTFSDKTQGVTLNCTKVQEEATYSENHGRYKSQRFLSTFCKDVPTHIVFGEIGDVIPAENREFIKEVAGHGFQRTSIVKNAGHLVVQQNPAGVAEIMWKVFRSTPAIPSKL